MEEKIKNVMEKANRDEILKKIGELHLKFLELEAEEFQLLEQLNLNDLKKSKINFDFSELKKLQKNLLFLKSDIQILKSKIFKIESDLAEMKNI